MRITGRLLPAAFLGLTSLALSGCTALVVGAAAGAVGSYVWTRGNLELNVEYPVEKLYMGIMQGLEELDIDVERDRHDKFSVSIAARDVTGRKVLVRVLGQTEYTSKLRIRVGVWGDRDASQMIMNVILKNVDGEKGLWGW